MLARRLGIPAFVKVHGTDINSMARRGWQRRQIGWALRHAAGVIAVSRPLAEAVGRLGARQADTLVLRNGLDTQLFLPRDRTVSRRRLQLPAERRSVLFVGNLKRTKGVMDLATAYSRVCAHHADVDLEYVGAGPAREELQQWITRNRLGDRVRLHGACAHEDVTHWLGACDLLCLPSHAEGMPNVVVEALASGRPVVATDVGGIAELMTASNGRLVAVADPPGLERALRECLDIRWNAEQIASGVDAMNWAQNASRLSDFLRDRCPRPPSANAHTANAPSANAPSADPPSTVASRC
jgi:glycosyltransferase involved in cell wall biosynthesis